MCCDVLDYHCLYYSVQHNFKTTIKHLILREIVRLCFAKWQFIISQNLERENLECKCFLIRYDEVQSMNSMLINGTTILFWRGVVKFVRGLFYFCICTCWSYYLLILSIMSCLCYKTILCIFICFLAFVFLHIQVVFSVCLFINIHLHRRVNMRWPFDGKPFEHIRTRMYSQ
jgi:hypothetical protein